MSEAYCPGVACICLASKLSAAVHAVVSHRPTGALRMDLLWRLKADTRVSVSPLPLPLFAGDGFVTRSEFERLFAALLPRAQPGSSDRAFAALDLEGNGKVDIVSWSHRIRLADMPAMVARIRRHGAHTGSKVASMLWLLNLCHGQSVPHTYLSVSINPCNPSMLIVTGIV